MKTVDSERVDLPALLRLAARGPALLTSAAGEFVVSRADDFDAEVEALRKSRRFQAFLDRRLKSSTWISLANIEEGIAGELAKRPRGKKAQKR